MESMVVRDLIPQVDATFRTLATREGRVVEGCSMGGLGTARWGLRDPDVFGDMAHYVALNPFTVAAQYAAVSRNSPRALAQLPTAIGALDEVFGTR